MIDLGAIHRGADIGTDKNRWNVIDGLKIILIPGQYQHAVMGFRPLHIGIEFVFQPGVADIRRAVMIVIAEIGDDKRNRREFAKVGGEGRERLIAGRRDVAEIDPRILFASVFGRAAAGIANARHVF